MKTPVLLYVPNLLGYLRIILAFVGLGVAGKNPWAAFGIWILSGVLDLLDGPAARALGQTSKFGVLLDIIADNILRSCVWIAASIADPVYLIPATLIVTLEWITFASSQLHAAVNGDHWKETRDNDPAFITQFFANNFRNFWGTLGVYGLFSANLLAFASAHPNVYQRLPYFAFFKYLAFFGRLVSLGIELWIVSGYLSLVLEEDETPSSTSSKTKSR